MEISQHIQSIPVSLWIHDCLLSFYWPAYDSNRGWNNKPSTIHTIASFLLAGSLYFSGVSSILKGFLNLTFYYLYKALVNEVLKPRDERVNKGQAILQPSCSGALGEVLISIHLCSVMRGCTPLHGSAISPPMKVFWSGWIEPQADEIWSPFLSASLWDSRASELISSCVWVFICKLISFFSPLSLSRIIFPAPVRHVEAVCGSLGAEHC